MELYFIRHGKTNYNDRGLCNDDPARPVHLTGEGIRQAEAAAQQLRHTGLERIIVSPLPRTRQTAEIINRYHNVPIETHPDIVDIHSGFDGQPVAEYFAATAHDPLHARVNGGESLLDHKQRVTRFLKWLKRQHDNCILIVAHEETLRVVIAHFERSIPDEQLRDLHIANCESIHYSFPDTGMEEEK
jgi:alpha-ribazole phosphatase